MVKSRSTPHFNSFQSLMEALAIPFFQQNPDFERLDGKLSGGNRTNFATFEHQGYKWKIAMDTRTDRLLAAWKLHQAGKEPFVQENTSHRLCLRLNNSGSGKTNGLFIYAV